MLENRRDTLLWFAVVLALMGAVAAFLAPHNRYFLGNFVWYWLPLALVVALPVVAGAGRGIVVGCALALSGFLFAYHAWVQSLAHSEGLIWLGYLFALPGAVIGVFVGYLWCKLRPASVAIAAAIALIATAGGLALNMGLLCATLIYCQG